jgi:hypothetical protein
MRDAVLTPVRCCLWSLVISVSTACTGSLSTPPDEAEADGGAPVGVDGSVDPGADASSPDGSVAVDASSPPGPVDRVTLPLEVIGPDGTVESITVHASDVSSVDRLYLQAYSIGYPSYEGYDVHKASIRLNDGAWVDVTDDVADCYFPESEWECIDGPYHTVRFEIPISELGALRDGANTLAFRFNWAAPSNSPTSHGDVSTGYRILDVQLRTSAGADAIDGTELVWDDPASWTAPAGYDTPAAIEAGQALWHRRDHLVEGWVGPDIRASCADCHADDGRDLAYFAFSNHSIVQRSRYHGLSEEQGAQIAAYIRSYTLRDPDTGDAYDPPGRPWAPPYQPGPTARGTRDEGAPRDTGRPFSEVSGQLWAAGAGVDWSLDRDADMWPYLQGPDGRFTYEDVAADATLNMRELPINLLMPDWNEWLPRFHPLDLFGADFENGSGRGDPWGVYTDEDPHWTFHAFESCWDANGGDPSRCGSQYFQAVKALWADTEAFRERVRRSFDERAPYRDLPYGLLTSSVVKWQAVKQWELVHTYDLEDEGRHWRAEVEPLTWIADARQVFDIAPHISGRYVGPEDGHHDLYLDNAWYQLQAIMNSGRGIGTGIRPTDWRYHFMHVNQLEKDLGMEHAMRFVAAFVKVNQNCDVDGMYRNDDSPRDWFFRRGHCDFGAEMLRRRWVYPRVDASTGGQALRVYEEILRANFRGFSPHPRSEWARQYGEEGWEPSGFTPSLDHPWHRDDQTPSHYYRTLDEMDELGASPDLLDAVARWMEGMNPGGNWEQWFR